VLAILGLPIALFGSFVKWASTFYENRAGASLWTRVDRYYDSNEGAYGGYVTQTITQSNGSVGFHSMWMLVVASVVLGLGIAVIGLLVTQPVSILFLLAIAAVGLVGYFFINTSDVWFGMIEAAYEGVCPSIEWYDSSAQSGELSVDPSEEVTDTDSEDSSEE